MNKTIYRLAFLFFLLSSLLATFFYIKVQESNRYIGELVKTVTYEKDFDNLEEIVLALSDKIYSRTNRGLNKNELGFYERIESTSFFNITSAVSLKYGGYGIIGHKQYGECGTMSRILLNTLWKINVPAKKLQLLDNTQDIGGGHTMIEFYDNGRWKVVSPSDDTFVWRNDNGDIATVEEIRKNPKIFRQIYEVNPNYIYLFDNPRNIRWDKLPKLVVKTIKFIIGSKTFDKAKTPKIYDMPRILFLTVTLLLSLFFGLISFILKFLNSTSKEDYT